MIVETPKDRVVKELEELQLKISKLISTLDAHAFGNLAIPELQVYLLKNQSMAMQFYANILQMRLQTWQD
jgi:hypothetical protein